MRTRDRFVSRTLATVLPIIGRTFEFVDRVTSTLRASLRSPRPSLER